MEDELNRNECDNNGIKLDKKHLAESEPSSDIIDIKSYNNDKIRFDYFLDGARQSSDRHYYAPDEYSQLSQLSVSCCKINEGKHSLECPKNMNMLETYISYRYTKGQKKFQELYKLESNNLREGLPNSERVSVYSNTKEEKDLVQDRLLEMEMKLVYELAKESNENRTEHFLLKDGIITKFVDNEYFHAIGVSKQFHNIYPKNLSKNLPELGKGQRTYAVWDEKYANDGFYRVVWYLKLREQEKNSLDHIVRCEVVKRDKEPIPTEDINAISKAVYIYAYPVPYDQDSRNRWRTHLYPIFETEQFCKSKFYSPDVLNYYVEPKLLIDKTIFAGHENK